MHHDLPLLTTIALGFSAAFVCGLIAAKLRLSPIVGYLLAGILIGPHTPGFVADTAIAEQLSEIGILLLMFGVGLHFSIRDLMDVRRIALPGAIAQIAAATILGAIMAHFWGWSWESGLMLGLALSVASTVVLLRALEEHNLLQTANGNIATGWLIIEDIVMVLALVLIPTLVTMGDTAGDFGAIAWTMAIAAGKIGLFIAFMLLVGRRVLPWLLMTVVRTRSRELFTLCVFAVAMGFAFGAAKLFGVSFALGAFFAGMMIRESELSQEAADKALPLQDAFAVLFFVSVGMLFNPYIIFESPLKILGVLAIILIGKTIAANAIILLFRYPLKTALVVSTGLAQIGEFSFILASIGVGYGIFPPEARDLILAGALISISLNPAIFHINEFFYDWVMRHPKIARLFPNEDEQYSVSHKTGQYAILVGCGRVGSHILQSVKGSIINIVPIEQNREKADELQKNGWNVVVGDGSNSKILRLAGIDKASAVVVAVPNPFEARRIVEAARECRPDIKLLVRAHNDSEMEFFNSQGVDLAIMGAREVASRMVQFLYFLHDNDEDRILNPT